MTTRTIYKERLPFHPLLGRNIHLDSESWDYALQPEATPIKSIRHEQFIPILDQGQIGSCTGESGTSCAYHAPFFSTAERLWSYTPDQNGAYTWYAANTREDSYAGTFTYPPTGGDDTGSDTLTTAKVAQGAGIISGYQMSGDLTSSLEALQEAPGQTGIPWFNSMFDAPSSGLLTVDTTSGLAGGHALCVDEVVTADAPGNGTGKLLVGGPNSWNESWGAKGRWYMTGADWWTLRQQQGDVYFWVPNTAPAPKPTPPDPGVASFNDREMWADTEPFRHDHHVVPHIVAAAKALNAWGTEMGLQ